MTLEIRSEQPADIAAISAVTTAAFKTAPHSSGTEARIIEGLRAAGALTLSLVAVDQDEIIGHAAFSPISIADVQEDWYGLGPVSISLEHQGQGIGQLLIRAGLERLRSLQAAGCVVLGDPRYYQRFGFVSDPALTYGGDPSPYFQRLILNGPPAAGDVSYHSAFEA
ncbi:N-acetyltransferase [Shinella sumterensis]|uniref:GNAT family N-acetyltransferase n=1 Tax=Shinella sumterensis TaxID=1967501 RepID=UPI002E77BFA0|nr:N-acetyltransferase [Shinella sumterensis]